MKQFKVSMFPSAKELYKAKAEYYEDKMDKILAWVNAYPVDIFPEPDFKKAHAVLKQNGMTLDAISASNMRHVLTGIKRIIED